MEPFPFDQVLIAPDREELRQALLDAAAASGGTASVRSLPLAGVNLGSFLARWQGTAEGYQQWGRAEEWRAVALAWWSDATGRKHCRVVGTFRPGDDPRFKVLCPYDSDRPILALVYPDGVFFRYCGGKRVPWVGCACGVSGTPESVGWMGRSCAACHDQREEGQAASATSAGTFQADAPVVGVAFAPKKRTLAVATTASVWLWDLASGKSEQIADQGGDLSSFLTFSPRGRSLLFDRLPAPGRRLLRYDLGTRRSHALGDHDLRAVSFSGDGSRVALATPDEVQILSTATWQRDQVIYGHTRVINCAALSCDGRTLATGSSDRTAVLWDLRREQEGTTLRGSWGPVWRLAFAPDSKLLALGVGPPPSRPDGEERVLLWDERTSQIKTVCTLQAHVLSLLFSPEGRFLIVLPHRKDGFAFAPWPSRQVLVWDTASGRELDALEGHVGSVLSAAFSPDGECLATGGRDGRVRLWPWRQLLGT